MILAFYALADAIKLQESYKTAYEDIRKNIKALRTLMILAYPNRFHNLIIPQDRPIILKSIYINIL